MSLKRVKCFEFRYIPFDQTYPILYWTLRVIAETRKEAELIALDKGHQVFDQDATVEVSEMMEGYILLPDEEDK